MGQPLLRFLLPDVAMPPALDAIVYEQDTELILRQDLEVSDPGRDAGTLAREAVLSRGYKPGSVVVREAIPLQLFAIVHDLGREPSCDEAWIPAAFAAVFDVVAARGVRVLAAPLLGTVHGRIGLASAAEHLADRLTAAPECLQELWLRLPRAPGAAVRSRLARVTRLH